MITLSALYRLAEEENIAVDCYKLKKREALSIMDDDGICYIANDPFNGGLGCSRCGWLHRYLVFSRAFWSYRGFHAKGRLLVHTRESCDGAIFLGGVTHVRRKRPTVHPDHD